MAQLETFAAYFARLVTLEVFLWISSLLVILLLLRKPASRALGISRHHYPLIALSFSGVLGLSLRFWEAHGTLTTFWLFTAGPWLDGIEINANFLLNLSLYVPLASLLVLDRKSYWRVALALSALSFVIETIQQFLRIGAGDRSDWLANSLGTVIGVLVGALLLRALPALGSKPRSSRAT